MSASHGGRLCAAATIPSRVPTHITPLRAAGPRAARPDDRRGGLVPRLRRRLLLRSAPVGRVRSRASRRRSAALFDALAAGKHRATVFFLGWIARRYPQPRARGGAAAATRSACTATLHRRADEMTPSGVPRGPAPGARQSIEGPRQVHGRARIAPRSGRSAHAAAPRLWPSSPRRGSAATPR